MRSLVNAEINIRAVWLIINQRQVILIYDVIQSDIVNVLKCSVTP